MDYAVRRSFSLRTSQVQSGFVRDVAVSPRGLADAALPWSVSQEIIPSSPKNHDSQNLRRASSPMPDAGMPDADMIDSASEPLMRQNSPTASYKGHHNKMVRNRELYEPRIDSISQFSLVAALVFAAAVTECGAYVPEDWPMGLACAYLSCMLLVLTVSLHCTLLSVLIVAAFRRMQAWDAQHDMANEVSKESFAADAKFQMVLWLFDFNADKAYKSWHDKGNSINVQVLKHLADSPCSWLGLGMGLFPTSCLAFIVAVALRMVKNSNVYFQCVTAGLIFSFGTPGAYVGTKLVYLMTQ